MRGLPQMCGGDPVFPQCEGEMGDGRGGVAPSGQQSGGGGNAWPPRLCSDRPLSPRGGHRSRGVAPQHNLRNRCEVADL